MMFNVMTHLCVLFALQVLSVKASQSREDDFGYESCKFLANAAFNDQTNKPYDEVLGAAQLIKGHKGT